MKVGIVGASMSGLYTALLYAKRNPSASILLFDKEAKAGKKILATGNGHCNLFHTPFEASAFNHPDFVQRLLDSHDEGALLNALKSLGIQTMQKDDLLYPLSYSAASFLSLLLSLVKNAGISLKLGEAVVKVDGNRLTTNMGSYEFDAIVFAFGGKSQAKLGSDGSMFRILQNAGYGVTEMRPSLCPVYSKSIPASLFGVRHPAKVTYQKDGKILYEERGEVQFKKDGISGIAVMNATAYYEPDAYFTLDLFPDIEEEKLVQKLTYAYDVIGPSFLSSFLEKPLRDFVLKTAKISAETALNEKHMSRIAKILKGLYVPVDRLFDFDSSQVTRGGISLDYVTEDLQSTLDPRHWFVGECLDIDGRCGGYNLGFALLSALTVAGAL